MESLKLIADFFFPRLCEICSANLSRHEEIICTSCLNKIPIADDVFLEQEFKRKFLARECVDGFTSLFLFETAGGLQHLLHQLKYNQKFGIGKYLGKIIAAERMAFFAETVPDIIIPIPLHRLKKAERGYNQSYFISKGISSILKIPVDDKSVRRIRYTESQTRMNLTDRRHNVSGVFEVKQPQILAGKKIIIVDDVITTGATVSELAGLLKKAGAAKVYAVSAAIPTSSQEPKHQAETVHS